MASDPRDMAKKKSKDRGAAKALRRETAPSCADRDLAILNMRLLGLTFPEIARKLPEMGFRAVGVSRVHAIVAKSLRSCRDQPARELRQLELLRLDQLQAAHYPAAMGGAAAAATRVLSIMDRRAKLLGLDAGSEAAVSLDAARDTLLKKLDALARGQTKDGAAKAEK
ncbi:hypothetical protein [Rhodoblastus sp.]|uniref:hypothetical protein n=1 Tax=Rhodoblastus sp. TaxID=1962975 RepID=UPI002612ECB8|nr:hypothetical protein [Rhodoblastus sp.]